VQEGWTMSPVLSSSGLTRGPGLRAVLRLPQEGASSRSPLPSTRPRPSSGSLCQAQGCALNAKTHSVQPPVDAGCEDSVRAARHPWARLSPHPGRRRLKFLLNLAAKLTTMVGIRRRIGWGRSAILHHPRACQGEVKKWLTPNGAPPSRSLPVALEASSWATFPRRCGCQTGQPWGKPEDDRSPTPGMMRDRR
jgi:hypothetical protein